ncbi:MAG: class I SAM-dependent methyltransferase [bacterium]|nr:class I SAM-dependent methyltransferase [bacterium]
MTTSERNDENLIVPMKYLTHLEPIQAGVLGIYQGMIESDFEILDVGCGHKIMTRYLACKKLVGVDVFKDYLGKFDVHGDVRKLGKLFKPKTFDVCLCLDLIEHLTIVEGLKLLKDMEKIATRKVIVFTPKKWSDNEDAVTNADSWSFGNIYNKHKSLWAPKDFKSMGYTIMDTVYNEDYIIAVKEVPRGDKK